MFDNPNSFLHSFRQQVFPAPPGLEVWVCWDYAPTLGSEEIVEGPFQVLLFGIALRGGEMMGEVIEKPYTDPKSKKIRTQTIVHTPNAFDREMFIDDPFDYTPLYLLVKADWESPWIKLGDHAFFTREAAEKKVVERKGAWNKTEAQKAVSKKETTTEMESEKGV